MNKQTITVSTNVNAPLAKVWDYWNEPNHIHRWAFASDDWEAYGAENDLQIGGKFKTTMAAKDKKQSFDFAGTYTNIILHELIEYDMSDGRHVTIVFRNSDNGVEIIETFEPEDENSHELQRSGWQAILDNFKKYVENN